jgi:hypothetical protein
MDANWLDLETYNSCFKSKYNDSYLKSTESYKMETTKFRATTKYAGKLKILFEIIFANMTVATWKISKEGMLLEEKTKQNLFMRIFLPAECFDEYVFNGNSSLNIGLSSNIGREFFKSIKNKDVINMYTVGDFDLVFEKKNLTTTHSLQVTTSDFIVIQRSFPTYTSTPVELSGSDYSQFCRSFPTTTLSITKQYGEITFSFNTGRSVKKLQCGVLNREDLAIIHREYYCEQLSRLSKMNSFSSTPLLIYYEDDKPLCFIAKNPIGTMEIVIDQKQDD